MKPIKQYYNTVCWYYQRQAFVSYAAESALMLLVSVASFVTICSGTHFNNLRGNNVGIIDGGT
jgi:hypothetical protein